MEARRAPDGGSYRDSRHVLLVGFPPLMLSALEPAFSDVAEVASVAFPGVEFDDAAEGFDPDLVVVDVTYLDESVVRPLITRRFAERGPKIVYLSDRRQAWVDDLGSIDSRPLSDASIAGLVRLASGSELRSAAEQ